MRGVRLHGRGLGRRRLRAIDHEDLGAAGVEGEERGWGVGRGEDDGGEAVVGEVVGFVEGVACWLLVRAGEIVVIEVKGGRRTSE